MLYLENMHRSAELKHWASIAIALAVLAIRNSCSDDSEGTQSAGGKPECVMDLDGVVGNVCAAALFNIAASKVKQRKASRKHLSTVAAVTDAGGASPSSPPAEASPRNGRTALECLPTFSAMIQMSTEELCDVAIRLTNYEPMGYIRKHMILSDVPR